MEQKGNISSQPLENQPKQLKKSTNLTHSKKKKNKDKIKYGENWKYKRSIENHYPMVPWKHERQ